MPCSASACMVRVEPKAQLLATESTESVMTMLKTEGRPLMPAILIATTKGEALVLAPEALRRKAESEGTMRPTMSRLTT